MTNGSPSVIRLIEHRNHFLIFSCLLRDDVAALFESNPDSSAAYYFILRGADRWVRMRMRKGAF